MPLRVVNHVRACLSWTSDKETIQYPVRTQEKKDLLEKLSKVFEEFLQCYKTYYEEVGVVGLAGGYTRVVQGNPERRLL